MVTKMKILTNSYPRSGATLFTNALRSATRKYREPFEEELYQNNDWIIKNHNPVIFLGSYSPDILLCTIVRNPLDAIASNSFRWMNGYTGNIVHGTAIIDKHQVNDNHELSEKMCRDIDHQIDQYISYLYCLLENPSNVLIFTYEQILENTSECIKKICRMCGLPEDIDEGMVKYHIQNPLQPTSVKTDLYFNIKNYVLNSSKYQEANGLYHNILAILANNT